MRSPLIYRLLTVVTGAILSSPGQVTGDIGLAGVKGRTKGTTKGIRTRVVDREVILKQPGPMGLQFDSVSLLILLIFTAGEL